MHAPLQPIKTEEVFERVHIDVVGPVAISHGYRYVLVITDAFSRCIEAVSLTNKRSETVTWVLLTIWICGYGLMKILHSDSGTEFVNDVITDISNLLGTISTRTIAYRPQGISGVNVPIVRSNRHSRAFSAGGKVFAILHGTSLRVRVHDVPRVPHKVWNLILRPFLMNAL